MGGQIAVAVAGAPLSCQAWQKLLGEIPELRIDPSRATVGLLTGCHLDSTWRDVFRRVGAVNIQAIVVAEPLVPPELPTRDRGIVRIAVAPPSREALRLIILTLAVARQNETKHTGRASDAFRSLCSLSPRQLDVAYLTARGATDQMIADELHISVRTVRFHLDLVRSQFRCRRGELARWLAALEAERQHRAYAGSIGKSTKKK